MLTASQLNMFWVWVKQKWSKVDADSLHDVLKADAGKLTVNLPYFNLIAS